MKIHLINLATHNWGGGMPIITSEGPVGAHH